MEGGRNETRRELVEGRVVVAERRAEEEINYPPPPPTHTGSVPSLQLNLSGRALCWDSGGPQLDQGRVHTPGGLGHSRSPRKQRTYSWVCLEALGPSWRFSLRLRSGLHMSQSS